MGFDPSQLTDQEIEALDTAGLTPDDLEKSINDIEKLVDSSANMIDNYEASNAGKSHVKLYEDVNKILGIQGQYNTPESLRVFERISSTLQDRYKEELESLGSKIDKALENGEEFISTYEENEKIKELQTQVEEKGAAHKALSQQAIQIEINGALDALSEDCEEGKKCSSTAEKIQNLKELYEDAENVRYESIGNDEAIERYEKFLGAYKGFMSEFEGNEDLYLEVRNTIDKFIGTPKDMLGDRGSDYTDRLAKHIQSPAEKAEHLDPADFESKEDFLKEKIAFYQEAKENLTNAGDIKADKDFQNQDVSFVSSTKDSVGKIKDLQDQSPEEEYIQPEKKYNDLLVIDREELERLSGYSNEYLQKQIDLLQDEMQILEHGYIEPTTPEENTPEVTGETEENPSVRDEETLEEDRNEYPDSDNTPSFADELTNDEPAKPQSAEELATEAGKKVGEMIQTININHQPFRP